MRISIVRETELTRQQWVFWRYGNVFTDMTLHMQLSTYTFITRPSKRHKFDGPHSDYKIYERYPERAHNHCRIPYEDAPCPEDVLEEAKARIIGMIHIEKGMIHIEKGDKPK